MGENGETVEQESGTLNRRRLLQGAAAAGIGAAVWTVPSITSLGGTPAYAANCTGTTTRYKVGIRNTSCNCEDAVGNKYVNYKELGTACGGDPRPQAPFGVVLTHNGNISTPLDDSGECAPGTVQQGSSTTNGNAYATVAGNNLGLTCRIEVKVVQKNCGGVVLISQLSLDSVGPNGGSIAMPKVQCATNFGGDIFVDVGLYCSKDEDCIYP